MQEVVPINILLHTYGALAFWDYAAAAPYVKIDMNPMASTEQERGLVHSDAIFISPHKMIGGPGTPGILVAKKFLFDRKLSPCSPGGGTVDFVTEDDQLYLTKIAHREEAGTPDIIGCVRAGLIFQLKHAVTPELIESLEQKLWLKAVKRLQNNPRIHLMGQITYENAKQGEASTFHMVHRVPTLSFVIYHQSGKLLHYNFVCALLDNLFGIQSRGGCVCAGPYGEYLLSMDTDTAKLYEEQLAQYDDVGVLRPGFVRLSLNFFISEEEADYVLNALDFIASEGWKLLPEYSFQPETNEWMHLSNKSLPNRKWLGEVSYTSGKMVYPKNALTLKESSVGVLARQLEEAKTAVQKSAAQVVADHREAELSQKHELMREDAEELRWFVYPDEAYLSVIEIESDQGENAKPRGEAQNFHSAAWRAKWLDVCPLAPRYFDFHPQALDNAEAETSASLMPKTHRFTATVTDLDSALNAKSQYTAKQMHLEQEEKKKQAEAKAAVAEPAPSAGVAAAALVVANGAEKPAEKVEFVIPETSQSAAVRTSEEEQERRLEDAVFVDDNEGLATHTHHADEEEEDEADMCCPIVPGGASACGVPAAGYGDSRSSVKSMIDTRKKEKKEQREKKAAIDRNDKGQSELAAAKRKEQKLARFDPVDQIEHRIFKQMIAAIRMFDLIGPGDRVLVGVSGGKDSLTLLNMLLKAQKYLPFKFEVGAVTVDPQTLEFDPSPLKVYMAELGVKYFYDSQPLISIANDIGPSSICAWCSRMKRGILHNVCEREGYNVLALGQHLDDLVESFLMYGFHNGKLDTMKAASVVRDGKLKIVRPFVFVREKDNKHYANLSNLPVITENCPACFEEPKERARVKALLKAQERLYPNLFGNLLSAIKPLMHPDLKLDETLQELDKVSKAKTAAKYYPKRHSEEDQAAYQAKREAHKAEQKAKAQEAKAKAKAEAAKAKAEASSSAPSS